MEGESQIVPRHRRRRLRSLARLVGFGLLTWLGSSAVMAHLMTARMGPRQAEPPPIDGPAIEEVRLHTSDGQDVGAWYIAGADEEPIVLALHGRGGRRTFMLDDARRVLPERCGVFLVTQRAHGDSSADRCDVGYSARLDVVAACAWIRDRAPRRKIILWGQSMGAAAGLFAAEQLGDSIAGYILESPYSDLHTALSQRLRLVLPWGLDTVAYYGIRCTAPAFIGDVNRIAPVQAARNLPKSTPAVILAGMADPMATPAEARAIAANVPGPVRVVEFPGAGHFGLIRSDVALYRRTVRELIDQATRP